MGDGAHGELDPDHLCLEIAHTVHIHCRKFKDWTKTLPPNQKTPKQNQPSIIAVTKNWNNLTFVVHLSYFIHT